jgi:hypothetical protein
MRRRENVSTEGAGTGTEGKDLVKTDQRRYTRLLIAAESNFILLDEIEILTSMMKKSTAAATCYEGISSNAEKNMQSTTQTNKPKYISATVEQEAQTLDWNGKGMYCNTSLPREKQAPQSGLLQRAKHQSGVGR